MVFDTIYLKNRYEQYSPVVLFLVIFDMTDVIDILKNLGAVITDDHFVYTSGKHGEVYINKDALYPHTAQTSEVGLMFAQKYQSDGIEAVVGPALGGIILSQWTAYHLSRLTSRDVLGLYTDKTPEGAQVLKRGYDSLISGKKVLIVEDLTTTGGSVQKVLHSVREAGADVISCCVMINRDPERVTSQTIGAPFDSIAVLPAQAWDEADLPEHIKKRPVNTRVGHGKKYLEEKGVI